MPLDLQEYLDHRENLAYLDFKVNSTIVLVSFILRYKKSIDLKCVFENDSVNLTSKKVIVEDGDILVKTVRYYSCSPCNMLWS